MGENRAERGHEFGRGQEFCTPNQASITSRGGKAGRSCGPAQADFLMCFVQGLLGGGGGQRGGPLVAGCYWAGIHSGLPSVCGESGPGRTGRSRG